jgi:hypothetical protein
VAPRGFQLKLGAILAALLVPDDSAVRWVGGVTVARLTLDNPPLNGVRNLGFCGGPEERRGRC